MRVAIYITIIFITGICLLYSCQKYKDAPHKNLGLTNPYCNDPAAVNYNVGFPGKPDNTVCFYPSDLFKGVYYFRDSIYRDTLFIGTDSFTLTIDKFSNSKISVLGFCASGTKIYFTADPTFTATADTTIGDSTTYNRGQQFCRVQDTLTGVISRDRIDTTMLHIALQVISDTGTTTHTGRAGIKK